jgi:hypothetical protein
MPPLAPIASTALPAMTVWLFSRSPNSVPARRNKAAVRLAVGHMWAARSGSRQQVRGEGAVDQRRVLLAARKPGIA